MAREKNSERAVDLRRQVTIIPFMPDGWAPSAGERWWGMSLS